ncbi:MAG: hypothetical protein NTU95_01160 [Methanothrix sp.]|nr:hypothetical protein [Methanothrix sp.]
MKKEVLTNEPKEVFGKMPAARIAYKIEPERAKFKELTLANPNYFGNISGIALEPVKIMSSNTSYEEIRCLGYDPFFEKLQAVIFIKKSFGYSGGICTNGSPEHVRFYLSYDNGATWKDQGMASFTAYDIPGDKPLEYAVTLRIDPAKDFCNKEVLPKVRAILSWSSPPPENMPNHSPVWGNVKENCIQIDVLKFPPLKKLLEHAEISLPDNLKLIDMEQQIKVKEPKILSLTEIQQICKKQNVPEQRYLFPNIKKAIAKSQSSASLSSLSLANSAIFSELKVDLGKVISEINKTDGNTNYEELQCIGLDPNYECLVGIFTVKLPYGFLGNLCSKGSTQYIAFWVDWGTGLWEWVGTAQANVHDISHIPAEGLKYAVSQPVNLAKHRNPCQDGPVIARVRTILSWEVSPPPNSPDYIPTWGNREETLIHIYPGPVCQTGDYTPYIQSICGVPVCSIDPDTGFAPGECPFGGGVSIFGHIPGAPNLSTPTANKPRYKISVKEHLGGSWQHLNDSFGIYLDRQVGSSMSTSAPVTVSVDSEGYYTYLEAPPQPGVGWAKINPPGLLAVWNTAGKTGLWEIRIEAKDPVTSNAFAAGQTECSPSGTIVQNVIIDLDQEAPKTKIAITEFSRNGGPKQKAKSCDTFQIGDIIYGTYEVSDEHFRTLELSVEPSGFAHGSHVIPGSRSYPDVPTIGESGEWHLDTTNMEPCGYVVRIRSWDRTIVSCNGNWYNDGSFVGFCLTGAK